MDDQLSTFITGIAEGYPILFIGSGFSAYAKNSHGKSLPTGKALVESLKKEAKISGDYPLDIIAREFTDKFGEHHLLSFLKSECIATEISKVQCDIISLPWRRIYTTNYDNVVELSAGKLKKKIVPTTLRDKVDHNRSITQCVHLNGRLDSVSLEDFAREIKLTRTSYLTDSFINTPWLTTFRNDLSLASSIIFVGYSMYDIDVARIVYEDPMLKAKTCFVDATDLDPILARELGQFGEVFPIGIEPFASAATSSPEKTGRSGPLTAFARYSLPTTANAPTGDSIISLLFRGEVEDPTILGSYATRSNYAVNRAALGDLVARIKSGTKRFVVHADLGNGKTVFLHLLRIALAQAGFNVLDLKPKFDLVDEDIRMIGASADSHVIIVEELYRNKDTINKICFGAANSVVIATSRTSLFDLRNNEVEEILDGEFIEIDLNHLDVNERAALTQIANENGLWGDLSARPDSAKSNFIREKCGNEFRSFLLHLFEEPKLKERIRTSFYSGIEDGTLSCVAVILFLDVANFDPDLFMVTQLSGVDFARAARLKKDAMSRELACTRFG